MFPTFTKIADTTPRLYLTGALLVFGLGVALWVYVQTPQEEVVQQQNTPEQSLSVEDQKLKLLADNRPEVETTIEQKAALLASSTPSATTEAQKLELLKQ